MDIKQTPIVLFFMYICLLLALMIIDHKALVLGTFSTPLLVISLVFNLYYLYTLRQNVKYIPIKRTFFILFGLNMSFLILDKLVNTYIVYYHDSNVLTDLVNTEIQSMEAELKQMNAVSNMTPEEVEHIVLNRYSINSWLISLLMTIPFIAIFVIVETLAFARRQKY